MAFFLFGNLISWRSKLQPFTAKSTHAAELIALSFAADEGVWLRRLLLEIGFVVPHVCRVVPADEANEGELLSIEHALCASCRSGTDRPAPGWPSGAVT